VNDTGTRYNKARPCPVCGTGTKGCSVTADGFQRCRGDHAGTGWVLLSSGPTWKGYRHEDDLDRNGTRGHWLGRLAGERRRSSTGTPATKPKKLSAHPPGYWQSLAEQYAANLTTALKAELAGILGIPAAAVDTLPLLGYIPGQPILLDGVPTNDGQWTFPERDAGGAVVGIKRRWRPGCGGETDKRHIKGGTTGLTLPRDWHEGTGPLFAFEGASDTITVASAGGSCVGRPSNEDGADDLAELLRDWPLGRPIIIVGENDLKADGDWPGKRGAVKTANAVAKARSRPVLYAMVPAGAKDARDWMTDPARGAMSWADRWAELAEHLAATAVPAETSPPTAQVEPPAPCPYLAAKDVLVDLEPACRNCISTYLVGNKDNATGRRYFARRDCGNGKLCPSCRRFSIYEQCKSSVGYVTEEVMQNDPETRRVLAMAILPHGSNKTLSKKLERCGAEYQWVETSDPAGCVEIAAEHSNGAEMSQIFPKREQVGETCDISPSAFLWTVSLPPGSKLPEGFTVVTPAAAIRAIGNAYATVPPPRDTDGNYKRSHHSLGWQWEEPKETSKVTVEGRAKFAEAETRQILTDNGICQSVQVGDRRGPVRGYQIDAHPAAAAAVSMLIRAVDREQTPDVDYVSGLVGEWVRFLSRGDNVNLGDGWRVQGVVRGHLWQGPLGRYEMLRDMLRAADEEDKSEERVNAEYGPAVTETVLAMLREQWVVELLLAARERVEGGESGRTVRKWAKKELTDRLEADDSFMVQVLRQDVADRFEERLKIALRKPKTVVETLSADQADDLSPQTAA
jgi:hypothetical protein